MVTSNITVAEIEVELARIHADPYLFAKHYWPQVVWYDKQIDVMYSLRDNIETYVPAGNQLGKDFVSGMLVLWFFLSRTPCKIITTSSKEAHLEVLWGEINRFLATSKFPLLEKDGGVLRVGHFSIKRIDPKTNRIVPQCYISGQVAGTMEALQGQHSHSMDMKDANDGIARSLMVVDEASGVPDEYYTMFSTWAKRILIIGNPWPCTNFFYKGVTAGDMKAARGGNYWRKVIRIRAIDSPNVRWALWMKENGLEPTGEVLIPGVKDWDTYERHRATLDKDKAMVVLDGEFNEDQETKLFPKQWLDISEDKANWLAKHKPIRKARAIGVDPAEGGDNSSWAIIDEYGLIDLVSLKTPDTTVVTSMTIYLMRKWNVPAEHVVFDRGGNGTAHMDRLSQQGYKVRSVGFGERATIEPKRGMTRVEDRKENIIDRYAYVNRRAEMYGTLALLLDPQGSPCIVPQTRETVKIFAIPKWFPKIREQLNVIYKLTDEEGRLRLAPKNQVSKTQSVLRDKSIVELLGYSPDEADALVLAVHGMLNKATRITAGAI